ncbi:hypothetical protein FJ651_02940 [Paucihalobacter ruber]|uniref:Uncharacterized protein n=1 Tax=Paucihalobacter ruber TaxID=2567861 RepID=A0A506PUJ6_9FLAO|nr:hypothetical protein [Paucihalobacter ruber]TPV35890.1 hypothetical protein FJ651_02940 [Paucihalobacter ruber]
MTREEFDEFFKNNEGNFIIGIHNYCDRWCERCKFTAKCSVFQIDEERARKRAEKGIPDNDFAEIVSENFQIVMDMMEDIMEDTEFEEEAIDLEAIQTEEEVLENYAKNHPISKNSEIYLKKVRLWFDQNERLLKRYKETFENTYNLGINDTQIIRDYENTYEAVEVINWFHAQIHVKLIRALRHGDVDLSYEDPIQNDANGSAKVALIGIEKSMDAWGILHKHFPEIEDHIIDILVLLETIRKDILKEFPNVNQFLRPGFDV